MQVKCFKPVIAENCKVLILGSVPSVVSRNVGFYYGNPANRFWKIISRLSGVDFTALSPKEKAAELLNRRIALSDVFSACEITGSLDSNIKNAEFNDIPSLIADTEIKTIYITSKTAYNAFIKRFGYYFERTGIKIVSLPSPSGANRSKFRTDEELIAEWKKLLII
ncbi:MAG: DNA-deoxyinosine glycosylase [Clostridia bacterium]|nr:DNA-deoxyinosine glycosylase [Clostridia bacterium]